MLCALNLRSAPSRIVIGSGLWEWLPPNLQVVAPEWSNCCDCQWSGSDRAGVCQCRRATPAILMQATTKPKEHTFQVRSLAPVFKKLCTETGIMITGTFRAHMMLVELSHENP